MNVVKHIICELTGYRPGVVDVSQGDRGSRAVSCRLLENGAPWMIPEGASVRVAYTLPDGTDGLYDRHEDGTPMWEIVGNTVTVELADQLMAQAGMVQMSILIIGPEGGQLATWPIRVMVSANSAARLTVPENMPPYGAGFAGKIFFGGADGTVTPLGIGEGVEVVRQEDGSYALVAAGGGGGIQEETDPTVPDWAKEPSKPSYTAQEVGALPAGTKIPAKTSDLTNDSGFINKSVADLVNYFTKQQTEELIAQIPKFRISVVQQLPAIGEDRVLYLVPFATAEGQYLEYIWVGGRFEVIGSQKVDLTGYATEEWVQAGYQPKGDYLLATALPGAIEAALEQAKAGGLFDGDDGITPHVGANGNWYIGDTDTGIKAQGEQGTKGDTGATGAQGPKGDDGADGRTPIKGTDYWTPADQEAIVQQVIAALGTPVFGRVDENKHITLSGHLADGRYTISFEDSDGFTTDVCTIEKTSVIEPAYTNLADPSSPDWLTGQRLNSSCEVVAASATYVTNYIPVKQGDVVRIRGMNIYYQGATGSGHALTWFFDNDKLPVANIAPRAVSSAVFGAVNYEVPSTYFSYTVANKATFTTGDASGVAYMRLCGRLWDGFTVDDIVITVNQDITE